MTLYLTSVGNFVNIAVMSNLMFCIISKDFSKNSGSSSIYVLASSSSSCISIFLSSISVLSILLSKSLWTELSVNSKSPVARDSTSVFSSPFRKLKKLLN